MGVVEAPHTVVVPSFPAFGFALIFTVATLASLAHGVVPIKLY
jgi:hypothetical protein